MAESVSYVLFFYCPINTFRLSYGIPTHTNILQPPQNKYQEVENDSKT